MFFFLTLQACEAGEELEVVDSDLCCPTATCVCKPETCSQQPTCDAVGHVLSIVEEERCCVTYECVCSRDACPSSPVPECEGGEIAVVSNPGECCPTYECQCDHSQCQPPLSECAVGYKLEKTSTADACCEVYECLCDESQCPATKTVSCPSLPGYRYGFCCDQLTFLRCCARMQQLPRYFLAQDGSGGT